MVLLLACGDEQTTRPAAQDESAEVASSHEGEPERPGTPIDVVVVSATELVLIDLENGINNHPPHGATGSISVADGTVALSIPAVHGPCATQPTYVARLHGGTVSLYGTTPLRPERGACLANYHVRLEVGPLAPGSYTFILENNEEAELGEVLVESRN